MDPILNVDTNKLINDLRRLIRIPSVSARNQNLEECAKEVAQIMKEIGIDSELIYFDEVDKEYLLHIVDQLEIVPCAGH